MTDLTKAYAVSATAEAILKDAGSLLTDGRTRWLLTADEPATIPGYLSYENRLQALHGEIFSKCAEMGPESSAGNLRRLGESRKLLREMMRAVREHHIVVRDFLRREYHDSAARDWVSDWNEHLAYMEPMETGIPGLDDLIEGGAPGA